LSNYSNIPLDMGDAPWLQGIWQINYLRCDKSLLEGRINVRLSRHEKTRCWLRLGHVWPIYRLKWRVFGH
jgi:hypothetical protein